MQGKFYLIALPPSQILSFTKFSYLTINYTYCYSFYELPATFTLNRNYNRLSGKRKQFIPNASISKQFRSYFFVESNNSFFRISFISFEFMHKFHMPGGDIQTRQYRHLSDRQGSCGLWLNSSQQVGEPWKKWFSVLPLRKQYKIYTPDQVVRILPTFPFQTYQSTSTINFHCVTCLDLCSYQSCYFLEPLMEKRSCCTRFHLHPLQRQIPFLPNELIFIDVFCLYRCIYDHLPLSHPD